MPGPSSTASDSVRLIIIALDAPYIAMPGAGFTPETEEMLTIEPPCSRHPGAVGLLDPGERAERVDLDDLAGRAEVDLDERSGDRVDAGVVDQQVEAAEGLDGAAYGVGAVLRVVGLARDRDRVVRAQGRDRLLERLGLASGEADLHAFVDQPLGDAQADPATGSGDDGDLAVESLHAASLLAD